MQEAEFQALVAADERHWWYRGRRRVLAAVLDRLELPPDARVLDAGCGSGRTLDDLARRGRVAGFDVHPDGVARARARGHEEQAELQRQDVRELGARLVERELRRLPEDRAVLTKRGGGAARVAWRDGVDDPQRVVRRDEPAAIRRQ